MTDNKTDLKVTATGPTGTLTRGQTVTYTVTVTNTGPAKATAVQVGAAFTGLNTTGVTYNPTAGRTDGTRTIPVLGSSLNGTWWTLPTAMNAGETRTFTITGTIATTMKGKAPTVLAGASTTTPETNLLAYLNNTGRWTGTKVQ
ncbi:CARDB domain-containing protein [Kitasatospora sp. NPDC048540]|uniref:CARDB domain-containing protein n=1 Tax=Kitasatospora sp. NPDC048540 TaxID=3155634 RepID=UPI0033D56567